jgi:ribosomal protein S17
MVTIFFVAIFILSCNNKSSMVKTPILLANLKNASLDTTWTLLNIKKIYPTQKECNTAEKYANLYICTKVSNGDTVYVFEECREVSKLAFDTIHNTAVVDKDNMTVPNLNKVTVFVPIDFRVSSNIKYFFAKLDYLTEY